MCVCDGGRGRPGDVTLDVNIIQGGNLIRVFPPWISFPKNRLHEIGINFAAFVNLFYKTNACLGACFSSCESLQ